MELRLSVSVRVELTSTIDQRTGADVQLKLRLRRTAVSGRGLSLVHRVAVPTASKNCQPSLDAGATVTVPEQLRLSTRAGDSDSLRELSVEADVDRLDLNVDF